MKQPPDNADLWVLAGQSNMAGHGFVGGYETPSENVWLFSLRDRWDIAREPFTGDRYDAVDDAFAIGRNEVETYLADPEYRRKLAVGFCERLVQAGLNTGLGLPFGKALAEYTGRPVGLVFCAKGDTRMEEWIPDYSGPAHMALYRATLRRIRAVNRPVKGILWYQGESDTFDGKAQLYAERMKKLVAAFRHDLGRPDLPFFYVQIATCVLQTEEELPDWNLVQELQRKLEPDLAPGGLCAAIDLPLCDGIHLATRGLRRLGQRLARLVRRQAYGDTSVDIGPRPVAVERDPSNPTLLRVRYDHVNGRLATEGRVAGFAVCEAGQRRNLVCDAVVSSQSSTEVELRMQYPVSPQSEVWYGRGMMPFCNLVDAADMAAPVFGPWNV